MTPYRCSPHERQESSRQTCLVAATSQSVRLARSLATRFEFLSAQVSGRETRVHAGRWHAGHSLRLVCGRSPSAIVGSNPTGGIDGCLLLVLSRGILPTVVRRCMWSRNLVNEEALTHWRLLRKKKKKRQIVTITSHLMGKSYASTDLGMFDNKMKCYTKCRVHPLCRDVHKLK
jgi:hypothetical protein